MTSFDETIQDQVVADSHISSLEKYKFLIDGQGKVASRSSASFLRSPSTDGFNRLRTSSPVDLFDNKNTVSENASKMDSLSSGNGIITYEWQTSSVLLKVTGTNGDRALRQSRYLPYIPGKSHLLQLSGVLTDSENASIGIVIRSNTSGAPVDTRIEKAKWNKVKDPSINFTYNHVFNIDFQWLGSGNVRFGIFGDSGVVIDLHEVAGSSASGLPYMRTPTLPMRFEILTTSTEVISRIGYFDDEDGLFFEARIPVASGDHLLREICMTGASEAGSRPVGSQYHANTRQNCPTIGIDGGDILAVRLSNLQYGHANRAIAVFMGSVYYATSQTVFFEVYKVTNYTDNGTNWTSVNSESACEFAAGSDIDLTITEQHILDCSIATANSQGSNVSSSVSSTVSLIQILDDNRIIKQNIDSTKSQIFLIKGWTRTSTSQAGAAFTWVEYS
jgi:hypothetical protein